MIKEPNFKTRAFREEQAKLNLMRAAACHEGEFSTDPLPPELEVQ